jgi:hypothetical protein
MRASADAGTQSDHIATPTPSTTVPNYSDLRNDGNLRTYPRRIFNALREFRDIVVWASCEGTVCREYK